jgi:hypothetical protein
MPYAPKWEQQKKERLGYGCETWSLVLKEKLRLRAFRTDAGQDLKGQK